jgi:chemotaxis protein methyltransferase WspC
MAMAMFDAGFAASDFTIEGVDVSTRNVAEATRAIYGRNSFRGAEISFRGRYFDAVDGGYRPIPAVLKQVGFKTGNLFDPAVTSGAETYDVVFCRNLLIYFDRELQQRALERLRQVLLPNGLLLVGPAESSLPTLYGFASVRTPLAFAFVKQGTQSQAAPLGGFVALPSAGPRKARLPEASMGPTRKASPAGSRSPAPARPTPVAKPSAEPASLSPPEDPAQRSLDAIERAANAGHLEEAKQAARRHIETFGPSPGVFYLLGLAHDASRAVPEAIENYRKALYLAPDHRETLVHLSLLLQRQGDIAGAKALNSRLGRIQKRDRIG